MCVWQLNVIRSEKFSLEAELREMKLRLEATDGSKQQLEKQNRLFYNELHQQQVTVWLCVP